jgi:glycosyltransferase involved in cell wall biosynthesis|tara:strand:- start:93616 stop:94263 length:648 start_codon:yes stop_codon:yes gene_type:complete
MGRSRTGIVIPALNEAMTIGSVVAKAMQFGMPIVVDDGSNDDTAKLARDAGAEVVKHGSTRGYDRALDTGFSHAESLGYQYFITVDADGQHDPTIVSQFIEKLEQGSDMVIGVRDRRQRFAEHVFAWVASSKWGIRDPLCGMKAYRAEIYKELGHFDSYGSIGTELAIYAAKNNKKIEQLAISTPSRSDQPRFGNRWVANKRIFRALWLGLSSTP